MLKHVNMLRPASNRIALSGQVVHASDIADFSLGCRDSDVDHHYRVFVTTLLGFGGNAARTRYKESLVKADARSAEGQTS